MSIRKHNAAWLALAAGLGLSVGAAHAADVVKSGDVTSMAHWYGRAGGLVGSDRVMELATYAALGPPTSVAYDHEVAERTNLPRDQASEGQITAVPDEDIAQRTNMPGT
jgi:hypothetical protein